MRAILTFLFALILASQAAAGGIHYRRMIEKIDHSGGSLDCTGPILQWPKDASVLYCETNLTAISGTNPTFQTYIVTCDSNYMAAGTCMPVSETCGSHPEVTAWYKGLQKTVTYTERIILLPTASSGVDDMSDRELVGPAPAVWSVFGSQAGDGGDVTVSYTIDCVWW